MLHVVLLVLSVAVSTPSSQSQPGNAYSNHQNGHHEEKTSPRHEPTNDYSQALATSNPSSTTYNQAISAGDANEKTYQEALTRYTLWLTVFTCAMALASGLLVWIGYRQHRFQKRLERPWIVIRPRNLQGLDQWSSRGPFDVVLLFMVHNVGKTPGWLLRQHLELKAMEPDELLNDPEYDRTVSAGDSQTPIGPGAKLVGGVVRLSIENEERRVTIFTGKENLYCFGFVEYTDALAAKHATRFCYRMDVQYTLRMLQGKKTAWIADGGKRWNTYT